MDVTSKLFYLGSAITNVEKASRLIQALAKLGWTCTYDWTAAFSREREDIISNKERGEIAEQEIRGAQDADVMVLFLPGGRGAHVELGAALASTVPVLLLYSNEKELDGGFGYGCIFYHHEQVTQFQYPGDEPEPARIASLMDDIIRMRDQQLAAALEGSE